MVSGSITAKVTLRNLQHTTNTFASEEIYSTDSDGYEGKIESMADDLASRTTRLHKYLDMLRFSSLSHKEKIKIEKRAEQEKVQLLHLKETIREMKRSYIMGIPAHHLTRLANHHPVWKTHCNLFMDQIQKANLTYEGENIFIRCALKPQALNFLKIFREIGEGSVLCINSDRGLRYEDGEPGQAEGIRWMLIKDAFYPLRRNMFRMVERIRAQWIFSGDKWTLEDDVLSLDFGSQEERKLTD